MAGAGAITNNNEAARGEEGMKLLWLHRYGEMSDASSRPVLPSLLSVGSLA